MKIISTFVKLPVLRGFREIEPVWELCQQYGSMICGGYARYCLSQTANPIPAGDVDLFPQSNENHEKLLEALKAIGLKVKHENEISVTFETIKEHENPRWLAVPRIQVIKPVVDGAIVTVGPMEEILNNFDFTIVRAGLLNAEEGLADEDFVVDDKTCKIKIKNIHCPISSTLRCIKYSKKGYWLSALEVTKMFLDWNERGPDYQDKLLDLLNKMKTPEGEEPNKEDIDELEKLMNVD
jgi:hypothetical protein